MRDFSNGFPPNTWPFVWDRKDGQECLAQIALRFKVNGREKELDVVLGNRKDL